jgi:hypothetical protein
MNASAQNVAAPAWLRGRQPGPVGSVGRERGQPLGAASPRRCRPPPPCTRRVRTGAGGTGRARSRTGPGRLAGLNVRLAAGAGCGGSHHQAAAPRADVSGSCWGAAVRSGTAVLPGAAALATGRRTHPRRARGPASFRFPDRPQVHVHRAVFPGEASCARSSSDLLLCHATMSSLCFQTPADPLVRLSPFLWPS